MLDRDGTREEEAPSPGRQQAMKTLLEHVAAGQSCSVTGVSNMGKSSFLRYVHTHGGRHWPEAQLVYVDCNRMLSMTDRGLYELMLRCLIDELHAVGAPESLRNRLAEAYQMVTSAASDFQVSLAFTEGLTALVAELGRRVVILLDEFDEPLREMEGRVFLNLRAQQDRYPGQLNFVVSTNRPLQEMGGDARVEEFCELFLHHPLYLAPLTLDETRAWAFQMAEQSHVTFDERDILFIYEQSGGHPGLVEVICHILGEVTGAPARDPLQDELIHRQVDGSLGTDSSVQLECLKIWNDLLPEEQSALLGLASAREKPAPDMVRTLMAKHLLVGEIDSPRIFSRQLSEFVRRQRVVQRGGRRGIRLDVDSGEVWVDGRPVPELTRLEYRLLVLLYGQLGKMCDKYQVVTAVWGEEYIDEIDDARIEKLVSRLRQKLEPDPANPRYLITVRGRGYKLVDE